jgi:hypothetical protein
MKITETIERECCRWPGDLEAYNGKKVKQFPESGPASRIYFCKHCGQLWHSIRRPGEMDGGRERLEIEWTWE